MRVQCINIILYIISIISVYQVTGQKCVGDVQCIPFKECAGLYAQFKQDITPQLTQFLRSVHCGFQDNHPKVCCSSEHFVNKTDPDPHSLVPTMICGKQNEDRTIPGPQAQLDEQRWLALLRYNNREKKDKANEWRIFCGGVLVSSRYVLTAAHCVKGQDLPSSYTLSQVRLGEWNISSEMDCKSIDGGSDCSDPVQDVPIAEIIAHEDYNSADRNQYNDIALLRLARDVQFTDFIAPVCLPLSIEKMQKTSDKLLMDVFGWGITGSRSENDVKHRAKLPVVNQSECARAYKQVDMQIIDKQICAGGGQEAVGREACIGDSGGPLMDRLENRFTIVGVMSYGPSPCEIGLPVVYTSVTPYVDWILSKLRP